MTQAITFPRIKIPNAAYSATTWSAIAGFSAENYSVGALSAVPSLTGDITAILVCDSNTTGGTYGVQNGDETANIVLPAAARSSLTKFIKLSATSTIDVFASNLTNVEWSLMGYTNHITHITPVDKAGSTGAGQFTVDCSTDVPVGAGAVLIECSKALKVGAALNLTSQQYPNATPRNHLIVPLNASRQFFYYSGGGTIVSGDIRVLGWLAPEAVSFETTFPLLAHAGDSVWRDSTQPAVTTVLDRWQVHSGSDSVLANLRTGSSSYNVVDKSMSHRTRWIIPSAGGLVDTWANNSAAKFTRYMGLVGDTAAAYIVGIDTLQAGATATVTLNKSVTTANKFRITSVFDNHYIDVTTGFGGSGDARTFTVPNLSNAADGIRLGAVIVTPTTDGGVGADFTGMAYTKADYKFTNIEDVVAGNVCEGDDPALAPDDQLIKPTTTSGDINKGGVLIDPSAYVGTQEIWRYVVSEFKWYNFTITTEVNEDTTPDAFTFGSVTNANLSTDTTGPTQATIAGVTAGVDILATPDSGLSYRFKTSSGGTFGSWLTTASNVQLGYVIEAKLTSSGSYDTEIVKGLDIGGTVGTLTVRTKASDLVPDAFTFEPRTNVTPGAIIPSKTTVTVEGVSPALDIAISQSGLEFRISTNDGVSYGSWRTTSTNVQLGHKVQVRIQTSDLPFTLSTGTLTIGGVSADFNATTGSASGGGGVAEDTLGMTTLKMEPL